ncbi:MAG: type II secretion system F family protein [Deltaproteobacteria bacterium]|nr:type II secretion system F family protein [Deltaproteobacteria bacterium]
MTICIALVTAAASFATFTLLEKQDTGKKRKNILATVLALHMAFLGMMLQQLPLVALAAAMPLTPLIMQKRKTLQRRQMLHSQMDNMLANLANAVSVTGNLTNAIEDVASGEPEPMQSEMRRVLHEIRLGVHEDEALQKLGERSNLPLFRTAITAMIVGKRAGGKVGDILADTAASIRELKRLDGVLKTKTAEARTQAWVMGLMPFFLCGALQLINPDWLTPLWTTPFGWVLLSIALCLEFFAVLLIKKILAVSL